MESYYQQFESDLDFTKTIQATAPIFMDALAETSSILELTAFRAQVADQADVLNERQLKVLNRLIDYELRGGFEGGMNNAKNQRMTEIGDRTALRDLNDLEERRLMVKTGQLKGTRYHLNVPHLVEALKL